ncbi:SusC/RagA family TonB-linked outer membrane protein, partial [Bacteroides thetaiotaomicron]
MKKYILLSLFFCTASILMGQEKKLTISGHVFDENNESLPGVSVYLKDRAGVGTSTDVDGAFKLSAQKGDMIIFSFIGYKKKEHIALKDEKDLKIILKNDAQQMDEVVITGMGTKEKKVNLTGAVTNVDISQIQTPATSLTNMLGGRVPGIISVQSSGEPGSNMSEFWIRGIGTFGASSSALVLIDGLEGNLNSIDPADIESFSVLKDASATAVYGVRGANGVVLVTTKHGTSDKMEVNVRANVKISYLTKLPEYLRAYDYAVLANEASAMRGAQPIYDDIELKAIQYHLDPDFYPDVSWQDEILKKTSLQQTYYASARGGGSIARYFVSMNMSNESAIYKQDENSKYIKDVHYNTYGMRLNVDFNLTKTTE